MVTEVFFDTSGLFALLDSQDAHHNKAVKWLRGRHEKIRPVTTEWVVGETCTLLIARKRPHLVAGFLDYLDRSTALLLVNPDGHLIKSAKTLIRRQAEQGYSFVDCLSFCLMKDRSIESCLTTDAHFQKAGFKVLLA